MRKEYLSWLTINKNVKRNEQKLEKKYGHRSYVNPLHNRLRKTTNNHFYDFYGKLYSKKSWLRLRRTTNYLW